MVNLQKGQKVSLRKEGGGSLRHILVGLGWDPVEKTSSGGFLSSIFGGGGDDIDCDASVLLCKDGRIRTVDDLVYYGNLKHASGAVQHAGDNLTGEGDGDDEQVFVDLDRVPAEYDKLIFVVTIYHAKKRKQDFGKIQNAYIRIVDSDTNQVHCRYDLSENAQCNGKTALICGEIYRRGGEWKFNAIGEATQDDGLDDIVKRFA